MKPDETASSTRRSGCLKITNLDPFERQKVDGKTLITRKASTGRISGVEVKLSTEEARDSGAAGWSSQAEVPALARRINRENAVSALP